MARALLCFISLAISLAFGGAVAHADSAAPQLKSPPELACDGKAVGDPCMDDQHHCARTLCQHATHGSDGAIVSSSSYQCTICDRALPQTATNTAPSSGTSTAVLVGGVAGGVIVVGGLLWLVLRRKAAA